MLATLPTHFSTIEQMAFSQGATTRLLMACAMGGVIGLEREVRHKASGLRTNIQIRSLVIEVFRGEFTRAHDSFRCGGVGVARRSGIGWARRHLAAQNSVGAGGADLAGIAGGTGGWNRFFGEGSAAAAALTDATSSPFWASAAISSPLR